MINKIMFLSHRAWDRWAVKLFQNCMQKRFCYTFIHKHLRLNQLRQPSRLFLQIIHYSLVERVSSLGWLTTSFTCSLKSSEEAPYNCGRNVNSKEFLSIVEFLLSLNLYVFVSWWASLGELVDLPGMGDHFRCYLLDIRGGLPLFALIDSMTSS